jgi:hypothetical protein
MTVTMAKIMTMMMIMIVTIINVVDVRAVRGGGPDQLLYRDLAGGHGDHLLYWLHQNIDSNISLPLAEPFLLYLLSINVVQNVFFKKG